MAISFPLAYHIVETGTGRHVAFRRGGSGPAVVLLHESPRSSVALLALAERLVDRFTVYAFDTPGFGLSDPLPIDRPEGADFADALAEAMDLLGLGRVPVYGTHTGAVIAASFGLRHPERTACLALDGYPVFTPREQAEALASYLKSYTPDWEGTHLAWLWSRVKDQFTVFPWYLRADAARLPRPLATLSLLNTVVVDLLSAGDAYRAAYASAFRFEPHGPIAALTVPTTYLCRDDDLLFGHLDRLGTLPANAAVLRLGADRDAWGRAIGDVFARHAHGAAPPLPALSIGGSRWRASRRVVHGPGGSAGFTVQGTGGVPLVVLPELPGCATAMSALQRELARGRQVVVFDPPCFGLTHAIGWAELDGVAACMVDGIKALGLERFDLAAFRENTPLGIALAGRPDVNVRQLVLVDPVPERQRSVLAAAFANTDPKADGGHLTAAWHQLRDTALWKPWTDRTPAAARRLGPDPDVGRLNTVLTEWLRTGTSGRDTARTILNTPSPRVPTRARFVSITGHPWHEATLATARQYGNSVMEAEDEWLSIAAAIERALAEAP